MQNKLPQDWENKKFVDICLPKEGLKRGPFGSAIKKEFFVPNGNKVYEQSNAIYDDAFRGKYFIDDEKYNELINFNVIPGDIIVSCSGTLGRISVIPLNAKKGVINQALLRIRIIESIVSKKFFLYFFRSADFQRKILVQSQGTAITNMVGMKDFKEIEIPLPPLETQHAIVSKIEELFSELDKGIEDLKTAQQQLKTYRQAVLKYAFEGKLTNKKVKDGELPKGWKVAKMSDVIQLSSLKHKPEKVEDLFYIGLEHIEKHTGKLKSTVGIEKIKTVKNKFIKGDILYGKLRPNLNKVYLSKEEGVCSTDILVLKLAENCLGKYLHQIMLSTTFVNEMAENTSGVNLPRVSTKFILNYEIPLPTIEEQHQIVQEIESRLSVADKMEENIVQSLLQAESLRQSILKKAFSGELVKEVIQKKIHKPKNDYFFQMQLIGKIAAISKRNKIEHGEMTIAKYAYLSDKLFNIPTGFEFNRWHLGPYPPAIKKVVNNKQYFQRIGNHIEVINEQTLFKSSNDFSTSIDDAVSNLVSLFSKYKTPAERSHKTELLATVCKVIEDIKTTDLKLVRASMKEWKIILKTSSFKNKAEKFNEEETKNCIKFIAKKGWDKKLIR